jgi:ubiquinone/menaquinone biosynthesis C-methylase UbiE
MDAERMDWERFFLPAARREGFYWTADADVSGSSIWDKLASEDPVHAAISTSGESHEREKSQSQITLLKNEVVGGVALDVGCGYGRLAKYLLPHQRLDGYIGLDGSLTMLSEFAARNEQRMEERRTPLALVLSPIDDIPLRDESVQYVFLCGVLLHNPKHVNRCVIQEAYRVLVPGGKLLVVGPDFHNQRTMSGLLSDMVLVYLRLTGQPDRNGPTRPYSIAELSRLFAPFSRTSYQPRGFHLLSKGLPGLPPFLNRRYRRFLSGPFNWLAELLTPAIVKERMCDWWWIRAVK